jgi:hypothetical protein
MLKKKKKKKIKKKKNNWNLPLIEEAERESQMNQMCVSSTRSGNSIIYRE